MDDISKLYEELLERLSYLESTRDNDIRLGKITEIQSIIIRIQDILLSNLPKKSETDNQDEIEIPKPVVSDFIIENATGVMGNDGMYYHFTEVIKLLKLYKKS